MEKNLVLLNDEALLSNPAPRLPVCLCLDISGSMGAVEGDFRRTGETAYSDGQSWELVEGGTSRIEELQKGIQMFYDAIREDETALYSAEVCIVTFNDTAECLQTFTTLDRDDIEVPRLEAEGGTSMGEGVNLALDMLEKRKEQYKAAGTDYFQPWLVLMTDGEPNGNREELSRAISRTVSLQMDRKLILFPIGIGTEAGMATLKQFSPKRPPQRLKGLKFKEFFEWLSQSVSRTSNSRPGETITLEKTDSWREIEL